MLNRLRRGYGQWVTSAGQLLLLFAGVRIDTPVAWQVIVALIAALSVLGWMSALRRARMVADTPTSQIASAAQGYVELQGRGKPLDGIPVVSPLNQLPCLWYRYRIERRRNDKWESVESGESDASFLLNDGSGVCLVDPEGAEIITERYDRWTSGDQRYTQWLILDGEPVYALGGFVTRSGHLPDTALAEDVKQRLAEWKQDMPTLLKHFDLNGDGTIDLDEWALARQQARREVEREHRELSAQPDLNLLGVPLGGQLYLISTLAPEKIERRFRRWSFVHLAIFIASVAAFGRMLQTPFSL